MECNDSTCRKDCIRKTADLSHLQAKYFPLIDFLIDNLILTDRIYPQVTMTRACINELPVVIKSLEPELYKKKVKDLRLWAKLEAEKEEDEDNG